MFLTVSPVSMGNLTGPTTAVIAQNTWENLLLYVKEYKSTCHRIMMQVVWQARSVNWSTWFDSKTAISWCWNYTCPPKREISHQEVYSWECFQGLKTASKEESCPFWSKGSFLRESIPNLQGPSIPLDWTIFQSDLCTSAALCLGVFALLFPQPGIPVPLSAHAGQIPGPLKPSSVMGRFQKTVLPPSTTPSGTW